jgi:hypothetical protein
MHFEGIEMDVVVSFRDTDRRNVSTDAKYYFTKYPEVYANPN